MTMIRLITSYVPGAIRTPDRRLRRALLYPAELLGHCFLKMLALAEDSRAMHSISKDNFNYRNHLKKSQRYFKKTLEKI